MNLNKNCIEFFRLYPCNPPKFDYDPSQGPNFSHEFRIIFHMKSGKTHSCWFNLSNMTRNKKWILFVPLQHNELGEMSHYDFGKKLEFELRKALRSCVFFDPYALICKITKKELTNFSQGKV